MRMESLHPILVILMEPIGWLGAALVLGAYALLSLHKIAAHSYSYHGMNMLGSAFLASYALYHNAVASVAVNVIWMGIGCFAIYHLYKSLQKTPK